MQRMTRDLKGGTGNEGRRIEGNGGTLRQG